MRRSGERSRGSRFLTDPLADMATRLAEIGAHWALIGAHAANRYRAAARTMQDIAVLLLDSIDVARVEQAVQLAGWQLVRSDADLRRLRYAEFGPLDVVIAGTDYQRGAVARAHREPVGGAADVPVLTVEDVILHKPIAGRFRDLADIEAILAAQPNLDEAYLTEWTAYCELGARWQAVRSVG